MTQLLIIDVQKDYQSWFSKNLLSEILELSNSFSSVLYLWDNTDGHEMYSQIPEDWQANEEFLESLNTIDKQYGFFRQFMDMGFEEEEIVNLAKFMIKHSINDGRDIYKNEELEALYLKEFKNSEMINYSFNNLNFYIPEDLIQEIEKYVTSGVVLVGGGRSQCLKEVALLLDVLEIEYTINEELTY